MIEKDDFPGYSQYGNLHEVFSTDDDLFEQNADNRVSSIFSANPNIDNVLDVLVEQEEGAREGNADDTKQPIIVTPVPEYVSEYVAQKLLCDTKNTNGKGEDKKLQQFPKYETNKSWISMETVCKIVSIVIILFAKYMRQITLPDDHIFIIYFSNFLSWPSMIMMSPKSHGSWLVKM